MDHSSCTKNPTIKHIFAKRKSVRCIYNAQKSIKRKNNNNGLVLFDENSWFLCYLINGMILLTDGRIYWVNMTNFICAANLINVWANSRPVLHPFGIKRAYHLKVWTSRSTSLPVAQLNQWCVEPLQSLEHAQLHWASWNFVSWQRVVTCQSMTGPTGKVKKVDRRLFLVALHFCCTWL